MFSDTKKLHGRKALFVIAQEGYQDIELSEPRKILKNEGVDITLSSQRIGLARGKFGSEVKVDIEIGKVNVDDYDVVIFIGGPGAVIFQKDSDAHRIARDSIEQGKILAAICIAPTILAYAGVLNGKKSTVWNGDSAQSAVLEKNGAFYTGEHVTIDGKLVTADGPESAPDFGKAIVKILNS